MAAALGAGIGVGLLILAAGLTGRKLWSASLRRVVGTGVLSARVGVAVLAGLVVVVVTGWVVGAVLAAVAATALPGVLGGKAARDAAVARTEAVASWTEMIRDSIAAASGL